MTKDDDMARPAKYTGVADALSQRIRAGEFEHGVPLPPEAELAADLGVHRLTLRKALGLLAQRQLIVKRPGLGSFVNPAAANLELPTILYVGETTSHFFEPFYRALCAEAQDRGKAITTVPPRSNGKGLDNLVDLAKKHERLICMEDCWDAIKTIVPEDVHVTRVSGFHSFGELPDDERPGYLISSNEYHAVKLAIKHLVALGHRRIGFLDIAWQSQGDPLLGIVKPQMETTLGYRAGLRIRGIEQEWLIGIPDPYESDDWQHYGAESIRHHFASWKDMPSAIICSADFRAAALIKVLRERGLRVPEDVSVVGIGNTPWAEWTDPQLTSICLGEAEMARLALVLSEEPEPRRPRIIRVDPELVERKSVAPLNG